MFIPHVASSSALTMSVKPKLFTGIETSEDAIA